MNSQMIKEYLVGLGFQLNHPQWNQFQQALNQAGMEVRRAAGGMSHDWGVAAGVIGGALASVVAGTAALMENTAQADLGYQIFARRMFMSADAAKSLKIATNALGYSIEDIIWGPKELGERFRQLVKDQREFSKAVGSPEEFERQMRRVRDFSFEFTRLKTSLTVDLPMALTTLLSRTLLGDDSLLERFRRFNDELLANLPRIGAEISDVLSPAIKDIVRTFYSLADISKIAASEVVHLAGVLWDDPKLKEGKADIESIGGAFAHLARSVREVVEPLDKLLRLMDRIPKLDLPGPFAGFKLLFKGLDLLDDLLNKPKAQTVVPRLTPSDTIASNTAVAEAVRVGRLTGLNSKFIYEQWAHETGNFTSSLATLHHNLAGIKVPGGAGYQDYGSVREFADAYARLLSEPRFAGLKGAMNEEQWAAFLKSGRYMEDSASNYARGMRKFPPEVAPMSYHGDTNVGGVTVHVSHPDATPEQISSAVQEGIAKALGRRTQRNLAQFQEVYS